MDEKRDTEYTLANIPKRSRDDHCIAVGSAIKTFVMTQILTSDELMKRQLLLEFLNNKIRDTCKLDCRVRMSGASVAFGGLKDSDIYGYITGGPTITTLKQKEKALGKMMDFFVRDENFEICESYGATLCVKSHWENGSKARLLLQWGDRLNHEDRSRLCDNYIQQSRLVLPLTLALEMWMKEQRVNVNTEYPLLEVAAIMTIFYLIKAAEVSLIDRGNLDSPRRVDKGNENVKLFRGLQWIRLLRFYAVEFDPRKEVVIICKTKSPCKRRVLMRDPVTPDSAIIPGPDTPAFQDMILCIKEAYLYYAIPRSVTGSMYHRILPTEKASLCQSVVFHKFALPTDDTNWKPLEPLTNIEWDPLVLTEAIKGKKWREIEEIKGLELESVRVRMFEKTGSGRTLRYVLQDDIQILSEIFHPWFYKYEFRLRPDELLWHVVECLRRPTMCSSAPLAAPPLTPVQPLLTVPVPVFPYCYYSYPVNSIYSYPFNSIYSLSLNTINHAMQPGSVNLLDRVINNHFDVDGMRKEDYSIRTEEVLADLHKALEPLQYTLQTYGSCWNGFGRRSSDLDVYVETNLGDQGPNVALLEIEKKLQEAADMFATVEYVPAEVPVVKFVHVRRGIEGDISCNNQLALRNTQLLLMYVEIDPRVKVLGVFLKFVTKITGINDSVNGYLSSYAFIIMLIHYLQRTTPPVLPVLQELGQMFSQRVYVRGYDVTFFNGLSSLHSVWPYRFANRQSVGHLWLGFLHYYLEEFDGRHHVITIRTLRPVFRTEKYFRQSNESLFAIEDPFILEKNLARSINSTKTPYFLKVFNQLRRMYVEDCYQGLLKKQAFSIPRDSAGKKQGNEGKKNVTLKETLREKLKEDEAAEESVNGQSGENSSALKVAGEPVSSELSLESQLSTLNV